MPVLLHALPPLFALLTLSADRTEGDERLKSSSSSATSSPSPGGSLWPSCSAAPSANEPRFSAHVLLLPHGAQFSQAAPVAHPRWTWSLAASRVGCRAVRGAQMRSKAVQWLGALAQKSSEEVYTKQNSPSGELGELGHFPETFVTDRRTGHAQRRSRPVLNSRRPLSIPRWSHRTAASSRGSPMT